MTKAVKIILIVIVLLIISAAGFLIYFGKPVKGEEISFIAFFKNANDFFIKTNLYDLKKEAQTIDNYQVKITSNKTKNEMVYTRDKRRHLCPLSQTQRLLLESLRPSFPAVLQRPSRGLARPSQLLTAVCWFRLLPPMW